MKEKIKIKNSFVIVIIILITITTVAISSSLINKITEDNYINVVKKALSLVQESKSDNIDRKLLNKIFEQEITESEVKKIDEKLVMYGIDEKTIRDTKNGKIYFKKITVINMFCTFFIISLAFFYLYIYIRKNNKKVDDIIDYSNTVINGNYELCISDNEEGKLSLLKNKIYDMTVILREKNELLDRDKKELKKLMEDISHQFKTPLTSLSLITELLCQDVKKEKKQEFLINMKKELDKLDWLISTLLKLSQFDAKAIFLKQENINVEEMLEKIVETFSLICEIKEVKIDIKASSDLIISCDKKWTMEAINNIVKNSIEHGAKNIILDSTNNPLYTEIKITDDGEGIDKKDLTNIFNRFYKSKNSKSGSVGIGLALVKTIMESQRGEVRVESIKGKYTTFKLKFYKTK